MQVILSIGNPSNHKKITKFVIFTHFAIFCGNSYHVLLRPICLPTSVFYSYIIVRKKIKNVGMLGEGCTAKIKQKM